MDIKEAAQTALDVQDACNLSGVLRSFGCYLAGSPQTQSRDGFC